MSITHPSGLSHSINRKIVLLTAFLSACALITFITLSLTLSNNHVTVQSIVYGISLFACSLFSYLYTTRYARLPTSVLRQLDHAAIFLLIAGTYTPFALSNTTGLFGIKLMYWVWGLALTGIVLRLLIRTGYDRVFIALYVVMGWLFLSTIPGLIGRLPQASLVFLGLGALTYSIGALIFARDIGRWTDPVWHACVLGAAGLHFVAVLNLVIKAA